MTLQKGVKKIRGARPSKKGASASAARRRVTTDLVAAQPREAVVVNTNLDSARLRLFGGEGEVTFRSPDLRDVVPGHVLTVVIEKRWTSRGGGLRERHGGGRSDRHPRARARAAAARGRRADRRDPYHRLWKKLTAKPRPAFEFDGVAWGALPGADVDDNPTCDAAELRELGREAEARALLMTVLAKDLRVLDAHAALGNMAFDAGRVERALVHYEIGLGIGELSLPAGVDIYLPWGLLYNRPFLRCVHGQALALWRLGRMAAAKRAFERLLSLNPDDNQGARFCWDDVRKGRSWEEAVEGEER